MVAVLEVTHLTEITMETIYIKRFIIDLPKKNGTYLCQTSKGIRYFGFYPSDTDLAEFCANHWIDNVDWYLEEITLAKLIKEKLPSNEERIKEQSEYLTDAEERAFFAGQKWIINKLTE